MLPLMLMIKLEKILKALANKRRLAIIKHLKVAREAPVGDIAEEIGLSFKSTSKHLAILASLDIIEKDQRSLRMFYYLSKNQQPIVHYLLSIL